MIKRPEQDEGWVPLYQYCLSLEGRLAEEERLHIEALDIVNDVMKEACQTEARLNAFFESLYNRIARCSLASDWDMREALIDRPMEAAQRAVEGDENG